MTLKSVTSFAAPAASMLGAGLTERGTDAEFADFFAVHYPALARYCWSLVRNREQAEDLAQEACSLVLTKWRGLQDPAAYSYVVATNLVRRAWRREALDRRRIRQLQRDVEESEADATQVLVLRDALARIPRRHRDVVLLHYYAGLSTTEIALSVGKPQGTVKRQLSEARALLIAQLEEEAP